MAQYDTKMGAVGTTDLCKAIERESRSEIIAAIEKTEQNDRETAFGVAKAGNKSTVTQPETGRRGATGEAMTVGNINSIRSQVGDWYEENFGFSQTPFYDNVDFFAVVHTHPGGDPSPSVGDMAASVDWWVTIDDFGIRGKNKQRIPAPNALGACARLPTDNILLNVMSYTGKKDRVKVDNDGMRDHMEKIRIGAADNDMTALYVGDRSLDTSTRWEAAVEMVRAYGEFCDIIVEA